MDGNAHIAQHWSQNWASEKYNPSTFYLKQTVKFKICTVQYVIVNISLAL